MNCIREKVKWPLPKFPLPTWWKWSSSITMLTVGSISKLWLFYLNSAKVYKKEAFVNAVCSRPSNVPLVSISNHHSCIDDPILSALLPWKALCNTSKLRWTPAAHDICFKKKWHSKFFALCQTIPIVRGDGVYQNGIDFCMERLNLGQWVHIFPEGRVNMEKTWIRFKWGVGRLIGECSSIPMVIPLYHLGFDDILPNSSPYIPRIRKKVTIVVGEPLDFRPLLEKSRVLKHSSLQKRKQITDVLQKELDRLKIEALKLHGSR